MTVDQRFVRAFALLTEISESACATVAEQGPDDVREVLRGACDLSRAEAWERLATEGMIPFGWVADQTRHFACGVDASGVLLVQREPGYYHMLLLATAPDEVEAAERDIRQILGSEDGVLWHTPGRSHGFLLEGGHFWNTRRLCDNASLIELHMKERWLWNVPCVPAAPASATR